MYGRRAGVRASRGETARLELTVENRDEPDRDHVVPYLRASPAAYPRGCSRRHVLLGEAMIHLAELSGARHRACRWTSLRAHDWPAQNEMAGGRVAIQTPQRRSRHARADTAEREQRPTSARTRPTRKCDERTDAAGARACASRWSRAVRESGTAAAAADEINSRTRGSVKAAFTTCITCSAAVALAPTTTVSQVPLVPNLPAFTSTGAGARRARRVGRSR